MKEIFQTKLRYKRLVFHINVLGDGAISVTQGRRPPLEGYISGRFRFGGEPFKIIPSKNSLFEELPAEVLQAIESQISLFHQEKGRESWFVSTIYCETGEIIEVPPETLCWPVPAGFPDGVQHLRLTQEGETFMSSEPLQIISRRELVPVNKAPSKHQIFLPHDVSKKVLSSRREVAHSQDGSWWRFLLEW